VPGGRYGGSGQEGTGQGAVIAGVIEGTPAAEAGLRAGDTVTAVDATTITSGDDLSEALDACEPGDDVTITWTDTSGQTHTTTITLTEGPAD
jgi:S1-C subfamily serine protease